MKYDVNYSQRDYIFGVLIDKYLKKEFPYHDVKLPQRPENMPNIKWGSVEHALYLFNMCQFMKGRIKSEDAFRSMKDLCVKYPHYLKPDYYRSLNNHRKIQKAIKKLCRRMWTFKLSFAAYKNSYGWIMNSVKLAKYWNCDPRTLFGDNDDYRALLLKIKNKGNFSLLRKRGFYGFREKMTSMLTYFYVDAEIIDPLVFPVPVDFHIRRIIISNEIVTYSRAEINTNIETKELEPIMRELTVDYCIKYNIESRILANVLWYISMSRCSINPHNATVSTKKAGRKTPIKKKEIKLTKGALKKYSNSCLHCPLIQTCRLSIPSRPYYINGILAVTGVPKALPGAQYKLIH